MNGRRMWKPASSVARKRPRRSTTKALCCGTTTAVREMMTITSRARPRKTTRAPVIALSSLLPAHGQHQAVHRHHHAALAARERADVHVLRGPRRTPQLRLADRAWGQLLERYGHLADH